MVLKRLLTMDLYREIKLKKDANGKQQKQNEEELILMTKGKAIDYFVLIIEGKTICLFQLSQYFFFQLCSGFEICVQTSFASHGKK